MIKEFSRNLVLIIALVFLSNALWAGDYYWCTGYFRKSAFSSGPPHYSKVFCANEDEKPKDKFFDYLKEKYPDQSNNLYLTGCEPFNWTFEGARKQVEEKRQEDMKRNQPNIEEDWACPQCKGSCPTQEGNRTVQ